MKIVELIRLETSDEGTFGELKIDKKIFCSTLEPPSYHNIENKSSIPTGQYICKRIKTLHYGETFIVQDVPGRTDILFHKGNTVDKTIGCILLGQYIGKLRGNRATLNSGITFDSFMNEMDGFEMFHLTIKEEF